MMPTCAHPGLRAGPRTGLCKASELNKLTVLQGRGPACLPPEVVGGQGGGRERLQPSRPRGQAGCPKGHLGTAAGSLRHVFCVRVCSCSSAQPCDCAGPIGGGDPLSFPVWKAPIQPWPRMEGGQ